jgi:hypothetical protein
MSSVEVVDFSLAEPDLASIIRQIYHGALREDDDAGPPAEGPAS